MLFWGFFFVHSEVLVIALSKTLHIVCFFFFYRKADPEQSNALFENPGAKRTLLKDRLEISEPAFISSTVTQSAYTVMPTRTAPRVSARPSSTTQLQRRKWLRDA